MPDQDDIAVVRRIADKHRVGVDAVATALSALRQGGGTMAQFSHPDFGGLAQWSAGGISMVGDMFDAALKSKFEGVMKDLAQALQEGSLGQSGKPGTETDGRSGKAAGGDWWPSTLGQPSSTGSQNDMRYAFFPESRRLVVENGADRTIYDTGSHRINGISQQQGGGQALRFASQDGPVALDKLKVVR